MGEEVRKYVIVAAGGTGSRMNLATPKQFLPLGDRPIIVHTLQRLYQTWPDARFIVALPEEHFPQWKKLRRRYLGRLDITEVKGGATRFHSVKNSLRHIRDEGMAIVHDACRPLFSEALLQRCLRQAQRLGSAVPVVDLQDSLRELTADGSRHQQRSRFKLVQTPQCFRASVLKAAYQRPFQKEFTDDATVVEAHGVPVHLVEGEPANIKITTPVDLLVAEQLLATSANP